MSRAGGRSWPIWVWPLAALVAVAAAAAVLAAMGHPWFCTCGTVKFWHGALNTSEDSQHLIDWYSFTHLIHGFLFYVGLWFLFRRWPLRLRTLAALVLEAGWEILENTPFIIERYREHTIALSYFGDSVVNSVSDIGFAMLGFWLAWRLPVWLSVTVIVVIEVGLAWTIRDNLTLNIVMLIWPVEAILRWQGGG